MAERVIVYWREIPAHIVVRAGRARASRALPERFQLAIDACAMKTGAKDSDAYLADWRRGAPERCADDLDGVLAAGVAAIDTAYSPQRLTALVAAGGFE